jgi:hypothetical protein
MPRELQLTDSLKKKLETILETQRVYKETVKRNARAIVLEMAMDIMAAHPEITSIRWSQYTPYFMDGDVCKFGIYESQFSFSKSFLNSVEEFGYDDSICEMFDGFYTFSYKQNMPEFLAVLAQKLRDFDKVLGKLSEVMEETFGDHAQVTILANGNILVEHYEHD